MRRQRIKFHQSPGDYSKGVKIAMIEGRISNWEPQRKAFKEELKLRERAVLKERTRRWVEQELRNG